MSNMIVPLLNRVVVRPILESKTKAGLVISTEAQMKMLNKAEVVAIGPGLMVVVEGNPVYVPIGLKVGDIVFVNQHAGLKVSLGQKKEDEYLVFKEDEIIGVWPGGAVVTQGVVESQEKQQDSLDAGKVG